MKLTEALYMPHPGGLKLSLIAKPSQVKNPGNCLLYPLDMRRWWTNKYLWRGHASFQSVLHATVPRPSWNDNSITSRPFWKSQLAPRPPQGHPQAPQNDFGVPLPCCSRSLPAPHTVWSVLNCVWVHTTLSSWALTGGGRGGELGGKLIMHFPLWHILISLGEMAKHHVVRNASKRTDEEIILLTFSTAVLYGFWCKTKRLPYGGSWPMHGCLCWGACVHGPLMSHAWGRASFPHTHWG